MDTVKESRCFAGTQGTYSHASGETKTDMRFSVFVPNEGKTEKLPVLYYLSGLTCTEENFTAKAGAQRYAAEHRLVLVAPDTSPRGANLEGEDESWDFGTGAGFYVDATETPWSSHYRMYSYVTKELPELISSQFPVDPDRTGVMGHSMGGHGALVCALRNPSQYRSASAIAPICAPTRCPWGEKALSGYLGQDRSSWRHYDSTELVRQQTWKRPLLVDQGAEDAYLEEQLKPQLLSGACEEAGVPLELRMQAGYDHSYFFVASFIGDHIAYHARQLGE